MTADEREQKAKDFHADHHNCCQSVVLAYADQLGIPEEKANLMAAPFGRGLAGLGEVCGCVSGMAMVAGLTGHADQTKHLADLYRQENGDIVCARLIKMGKRPCRDLVGCAARLLHDNLPLDKQE